MGPSGTECALHACCPCTCGVLQARGRVPGKTGVWVGERKIGAVGVRITHGISSHGIALNVATDLAAYQHIVPCGTPDKEMTSVLRELQGPGRGHIISSSCASVAASNKSCAEKNISPRVDLAGVHTDDQRGQQQQQQQFLVEAGDRFALMAAAEACLVSALARMTNLEVKKEVEAV